MDELRIQWSTMKTVKARDGFSIYYVAFPQGTTPTETYEYALYATNQVYIYVSRATLTASSDPGGSSSADFEANYQSGAISAQSYADAIALAVPAISNAYMPQQVWVESDITTTTTAKEQVVVSYTVPAGYDFYILTHSLARITDNGIEAVPAALEVIVGVSTIIKIEHNVGITGDTHWESGYSLPLKLATANNTVRVVVTPSGLLSTVWSGRITGFLRSL